MYEKSSASLVKNDIRVVLAWNASYHFEVLADMRIEKKVQSRPIV